MAMYEFKFSDIGEGLEEGKIVQIHIKEGDMMEEGQPAFNVETDKVTTDIPAPVKGKVLKILVKEGDVVNVGQVLAHVEQE